jgi:peptidoglycan hydrolase-like protein with peptidoglycan-binding domain
MRRVLSVSLMTLCVVVGAVVPAAVPVATAQSTTAQPAAQPCIAQPVLQATSTGSGVFCLQFALIMRGWSVPYSGTYGPETEAAVRSFQAAHPPLVADGTAGEATLQALGIAGKAAVFVPEGALGAAPVEAAAEAATTRPERSRCAADAVLTSGARGLSVSCLQQRLVELGSVGLAVSGVFDRATADAVRAYQQRTPPLSADGVAGPRTLAALGIWSGITSGRGRDIGPGPFPAGMQQEPEWRLTADGIPVYGNRQACTPEQAAIIAAEFANDGADALTQQWAVYVASREGGCRHDAVNLNLRTRDDSHCTFQLNALSGMFGATGELGRRGWNVDNVKASLQACADAASDLWVYCGRGPWTPPYSCQPPWQGSTVDQPPALLPPPPESPVPEPAGVGADPAVAPPSTAPPSSAPAGDESVSGGHGTAPPSTAPPTIVP